MIKILLNSTEFTKKPNGGVIGKITNSILREETEMTIQDFSKALGQGRTTVLATYGEGVKLSIYSNIEQQQAIMLDFDNEDENKLYQIEDLMKDQFMLENASFFYKTFSNKDSKYDKFRVVFILEKSLTRTNEVVNLYKILLNEYKQADQVVFNPNRLFFGGYDNTEINYENTLDVSSYDLSKDVVKLGDKVVNNQVEIEDLTLDSDKVYVLLKRNNYEKAKELIQKRYGNKLSLKFESVYSASTTLSSMIKMKDFLDLPQQSMFRDILHMDNNPSASVFYADTLGIDLYKCHSANHEITVDIINLVSKLTGLNNRFQATKLLIELTGSKVVYNDEINEVVDSIRFLMNTLTNLELLEKQYKNIHVIAKNYLPTSKLVVDEMLNYTSEDENGVRVINFLSQEALVSKLLMYDININKSKVRRSIDVLVFLGIIDKLKDSQVPEVLLDRLKKQQEDKKNIRRSNVYELTLLEDNLLESIDAKCEILRKEKFTITSNLNGEYLYRLFGKKEALRVFPQFKPNDLELSSEENILSENSKKLEINAVKFIMKNISENGYVLEEDVKKYLKRYMKKDYSEFKYKTIRFSIFEDYQLDRVKSSNKIKDLLGIEKEIKNKFMYIER